MTDTTAVRRGHTFDVGRLHTYLQANLSGYGGPLAVKQFGFGQSNPTFLLTTPRQQYVLRKKPPGRIVPSAHAVEREFRVLEALGKANARQSSGAGAGAGAGAAAAGVPVPAVYLLCTDATVIGTPFYIMEYVRGRIFTDPFMPTESPQHRAACYADAVNVLAALHAASHRDLGLGKFGRPAGYYSRQLSRLGKVHALQCKHTDPIPEFDLMMKWLSQRMPPDASAIVHGDFKLDNLIFHPSEPRVIAVLDWEMSTIGHPMADVANLAGAYYMPRVEPSSGKKASFSQGLLGAELEGSGVPTEAELLAHYCRLVGRRYPDAHWPFYLAFLFFKLCVILHGIAARSAQGIASSAMAGRAQSMVPVVASVARMKMEEGDDAGLEARSRL